MGVTNDGQQVPVALREVVGEIFEVTNGSALSTSTPSTRNCVDSSWPSSRASAPRHSLGVTCGSGPPAPYTVGANTFLFDPSQDPQLRADRLAELLGVPASTMAGKAKKIRDTLGLVGRMHIEFCRRELLEDHPLAWLVEVDGVLIDARWLPPELQAEARRRGLIPDLPFDQAA